MESWKIDPAHSEIKFKVKHLVISTVTGQFTKFTGSVEGEQENFTDAQIIFEAETDSISTHNAQRDAHLKSPDFFDAAKHPKLLFVSKSFTRKNGNEFALTGDMTLKGVTKEVTLNAVYNGTVVGFDGEVAAFEIEGKINRRDFGLTFNALTETGGVVVSDEVKLEILVELKRAAVEHLKAA